MDSDPSSNPPPAAAAAPADGSSDASASSAPTSSSSSPPEKSGFLSVNDDFSAPSIFNSYFFVLRKNELSYYVGEEEVSEVMRASVGSASGGLSANITNRAP
jgi:hypothetical protein